MEMYNSELPTEMPVKIYEDEIQLKNLTFSCVFEQKIVKSNVNVELTMTSRPIAQYICIHCLLTNFVTELYQLFSSGKVTICPLHSSVTMHTPKYVIGEHNRFSDCRVESVSSQPKLKLKFKRWIKLESLVQKTCKIKNKEKV